MAMTSDSHFRHIVAGVVHQAPDLAAAPIGVTGVRLRDLGPQFFAGLA
jgi:hypothetical protein